MAEAWLTGSTILEDETVGELAVVEEELDMGVFDENVEAIPIDVADT